MKRVMMVWILILPTVFVGAINYPSYQQTTPNYGVSGGSYNTQESYNGYSSFGVNQNGLIHYQVALDMERPMYYSDDASSYDGENNSGSASAPRRAVVGGTPTHTWEWNGKEYGMDDSGNVYLYDPFYKRWIELTNTNPGDVGDPYSPIGDPVWPMLAFALMAVGVIGIRKMYEKNTPAKEK